jgi:nucleoside-diphosphate-sugar epimerase
VTGGVGFIGSNLVHELVRLGSRVTIADSLIAGYGGNLHNLEGIRDRVWLSVTDVRDVHAMEFLVAQQEIIFNLAGQVSHQDSMDDPFADLDINCRSQLALLEVCRRCNPGARVVFTSTRQVYGRPRYLPVDEQHPVDPADVNGINKLAGERYHTLYQRVYGIPTVVLRLTNTYGPRQLMMHNRQGFIAWFVRQAVEGGEIKLYDGGSQRRDLNYVDDVVDALLRAALVPEAVGKTMNLGGPSYSLREIAEMLRGINPDLSITSVPFPADRKKIDIGDYVGNYQLATTVLGWTPSVDLREGLTQMVNYYRAHREAYW